VVPSRDGGSLIDFGVGTRGLSPDEGILTRRGHRRRVTGLRRHMDATFDMFAVPGPVSFTLKADNGREWSWPAASGSREEQNGIPFRPGQSWRSLYDLSELRPDLAAGHYQLVAAFSLNGDHAVSRPAQIEVRRSVPRDHAIADRLRTANDARESSWRAFLTANWSTPDGAGLSESGRARLAYYFYLHRVAYGQRPVANLEPDEPGRFGHGVLEAEGALLRLEILHAAARPEVKGITAAVLERWPGLAWRVRDIERGHGLLSILRTVHGVESPDAPKDKPHPYR
jgi:hypothetical protein